MVFNAFGPRNELLAAAMANAQPVQQWIMDTCRREALRPGSFGARIWEAVDAGKIPEEWAPLLVRSLLSAGLDTTINGIAAAIYALATHPEQWSLLRQEPPLAKSAFEETIRWESPVQTFFRTTTRAARIGEVEIDEGQKVLMFLGAANRDPRQWDKPETYDIRRKTTGHVGFGAGIHMCVGEMLARLEGEVVLAALARKVASIGIEGSPQRRYNNTLRGLSSLPVAIEPA